MDCIWRAGGVDSGGSCLSADSIRPGDLVRFWVQEGSPYAGKTKWIVEGQAREFAKRGSLGLVVDIQGQWVWASWNFLDGGVSKCLASELEVVDEPPLDIPGALSGSRGNLL